MSRTIKIFIAASVFLNLLMAGAIIGQAGRYAIAPRTSLQASMQDIVGALPENKRKPMEAVLQKTQAETAMLRQQISDSRKQAEGILKAEPFDRQSYITEAKHLQGLKDQLMQRVALTIADIAAQCTSQERAMMATTLSRPKPSLLPENTNQ